jgi:hypothetical protein
MPVARAQMFDCSAAFFWAGLTLRPGGMLSQEMPV